MTEHARREASQRQAAPTVNEVLYAAGRRLLAPLQRAPWWLQVSIMYAAARLVSFAILAGAAYHAAESPWSGAQPDYLAFINRWDAGWYERIFAGGYPSAIPRNPDGTAQPNQWAFYPLFPLLVRGLNAVTGLPWAVAGPLVATAAGLAAALMIYLLFRHFASPGTAVWGVAFFAFFPVSPILQVAYAESLNTFLLAAALYLLIRRRYWTGVPVVVLLCLSRPAGVPFAAVVGMHLLLRLRHRCREPFPPREVAGAAVLLAASAVMALAWMLAAWWATGDRSAYTDTETAWRGTRLVLFKPWFDAGVALAGPFWGPLLPLLLVALAALYLNSRAVRRIGTELRLWCAFYLLYLLAVLDPQSSTFRVMLPLFPLALAAAFISAGRAYRWAILTMFTVLQLVWVVWLWQFSAISTGQAWPP
ncbi:hypothetical protein [Arthrobacter livingstonensis]|uniref:hypothetical protein n=1 Tax=Arthrobacter livingstonensis TaxID=670078 RepID=UPI001FE285FB|nr:hypothetical protein [Arthrobacter livingstonensis]